MIGLMVSIRLSLAMSFLGRYTGMTVVVMSTIVLAWLLMLGGIGLYALLAFFAPVAHHIREFELDRYLIQATELTENNGWPAFTFTLVIVWSIAVLFVTLSPFLAAVYVDPTVQQILLDLALNFVTILFGSVSLVLLLRHIRLGAIFRIIAMSAIVCAVKAMSLVMMSAAALESYPLYRFRG